MKKEIIISEFNLDNRDRNPDNVILTILGKYYFRYKNEALLWKNTDIFDFSDRASLVSSLDDYTVDLRKDEKQKFIEYVSVIFNLKKFFQPTVQIPFISKPISVDKAITTINKYLLDSYYYGLSKNVNDKKEIWLKYGKTFYDYSTSLLLPISVPNESNEKKLVESGVLTPIAKIQPYYNYYDKNYEKVSTEKDETSLFNFYSLYYYLNEQNIQEQFLNDSVFALMKNYDETFFDDYLASTKTDLLSKLKKYKQNNKEDIKKTKVFITPAATKFINSINNAKFRQPYGIEVSFAAQPVGALGKIIKGTDFGIKLEQLLLEQPAKSFDLFQRTYATEFFSKDEKTLTKLFEDNDIRAFDLNTFFNNSPDPLQLAATFSNKNNLILDKAVKKESPFLEQIKQKILKDQIDDLASENLRDFSTLVLKSEAAYSEVLFYEIKKYKAATTQGVLVPGQLIQQIIIPNSEDTDTIQYFDTQVKYNKEYFYTVTAWTAIIGNKYKYFDRTIEPKTNTANPKYNFSANNPNAGLPELSDGQAVWNPRLHAIGDNKKLKLDFGVFNQPDIIMAGLPYVSAMNSRVLAAPPAPPEITFVPYKNVSNKIKFMFNNSIDKYRDFPIQIDEKNENETEFFLLEYEEKTRGIKDGKVTFSSDDPISKFLVYKLEEKPSQYSDFANKVTEIDTSKDGYAFLDNIESNKKYYYTFRSVDIHGAYSNPTVVYEVEIVDNSGAVYPIVNITEFDKQNTRYNIRKTTNQIKLRVDPDHILEKPGQPLETAKFIDGKLSEFGSKTLTVGDKKYNMSIFGKNFKIRITSKATKKKIDINVLFTRQFKQSIQD